MSRKQPDRIVDVGEKIGGARKDTAVKTGKSLKRPKRPADPRPVWARRFEVMEQIDRATQQPTGKFSIFDVKTNSRYGGRAILRDIPSFAEAEKRIPLAAAAQKHSVFSAGDGQFGVFRKVTDRKRVQIGPAFASRDDAMRYMAQNPVQILETKTGFGEEILRKPDDPRRTGVNRRPAAKGGGRVDVTGQTIQKAFGLRGIEFGNWQNQPERQTVMNAAYDGFRDLNKATGLHPKSVGLDGKLGVAFGARGHGLQGARAHFERNYNAINLTKMQGSGALAHEWWHAFDDFLGRMRDPRLTEMVDDGAGGKVRARPDSVYLSFNQRAAGALPDPVAKAMQSLVETIESKPVQVPSDTKQSQRFVDDSKSRLTQQIDGIRSDLARKLEYGKRFVAPASADQLKRFDAAAARIVSGETSFAFRDVPESKSRWGRRVQTNAALDEMSRVMKEVRGRAGFDGQHNKGPLDRVRQSAQFFKTRQDMLAAAASESTSMRRVPTDFAINAKRIDQGRVENYWSTRHEMTARAFSAYVEDKIEARGKRSEFLSFGSKNELYGIKPFPEGPERANINKAFDRLFETVRKSEVLGSAKPARAGLAGVAAAGWEGTDRPTKKPAPASAASPVKAGTLKDLRNEAKAAGIKGHSKMKKAELQQRLSSKNPAGWSDAAREAAAKARTDDAKPAANLNDRALPKAVSKFGQRHAVKQLKDGSIQLKPRGEPAFTVTRDTVFGLKTWEEAQANGKRVAAEMRAHRLTQNKTSKPSRSAAMKNPSVGIDDVKTAALKSAKVTDVRSALQGAVRDGKVNLIDPDRPRTGDKLLQQSQKALAMGKPQALAKLEFGNATPTKAELNSFREVHGTTVKTASGFTYKSTWYKPPTTAGATAMEPLASRELRYKEWLKNGKPKTGKYALGLTIAAPFAVALMAYDSTRSSAMASGADGKTANTSALKAAAVAGGATAGIGLTIGAAIKYGMKASATIAKVAPRVLPWAMPAFMAAGAISGYREGGVRGAALGALDVPTFGAASYLTNKFAAPAPDKQPARGYLNAAARVKSVNTPVPKGPQSSSRMSKDNSPLVAHTNLDGTTGEYTRAQIAAFNKRRK